MKTELSKACLDSIREFGKEQAAYKLAEAKAFGKLLRKINPVLAGLGVSIPPSSISISVLGGKDVYFEARIESTQLPVGRENLLKAARTVFETITDRRYDGEIYHTRYDTMSRRGSPATWLLFRMRFRA